MRRGLVCQILAFLLLPAFFSYAADKEPLSDRLIAAAFKSLARGFTAVADLEKLKQANIKRLEKMAEAKFQRQYAKVYPLLNQLPAEIKAEYAVKENMPKGQAIANVKALNKEKVYRLIDAVPDGLIAQQFRLHLVSLKDKAGSGAMALLRQVRAVWDKIIKRALPGN